VVSLLQLYIKVVLDQWLELKNCFNIASLKEKCHSAKILLNMFKDDSNLLYLTFLKPVLREVNDVNLKFQSENTALTKVYRELKSLMMSIAKRLIRSYFLRDDEYANVLCLEDINKVSDTLKNSLALLPIDDAVDFGYAFSILADKKTKDPKLLNMVKSNCEHFLLFFCQEFVKRLPHNVKCLQKFRYFLSCISIFRHNTYIC